MQNSDNLGSVFVTAIIMLFIAAFVFWAGWNLIIAPRMGVTPLSFSESIGAGLLWVFARGIMAGGGKKK